MGRIFLFGINIKSWFLGGSNMKEEISEEHATAELHVFRGVDI